MRNPTFTQSLLGLGAVLGLALASGCSGLFPKGAPPPLVYALDGAHSAMPSVAASATGPTLIVQPTRAAAGFESQHILYVRATHQVEHFAHSEWVDTPARMLAPLIASAMERTGQFRAVVAGTSGIAGQLRLDTELLRLQQTFGNGPSRVRFTLRATLSDSTTRQVVAWREFDEAVLSESEDPYGGVVAANRAAERVIDQLAHFCALASASWWASNRAGLKAAGQ